jgi:hypothetical protein
MESIRGREAILEPKCGLLHFSKITLDKSTFKNLCTSLRIGD